MTCKKMKVCYIPRKKKSQWEISPQISNFESSTQRLKIAITDMLKLPEETIS